MADYRAARQAEVGVGARDRIDQSPRTVTCDDNILCVRTRGLPQQEGDLGRARILKAECLSMSTTSTPISAQEQAKRQQALIATIAHLRIEDLLLDNDLKRIFQRHVDGEIGDEELAAAINELNERRFGPLPVSGNGRP